MSDLVLVFKDMVEAQDQAQAKRLAGQDFKLDRLRGEKLEKIFNDRMQAMARDGQLDVVGQLILDGYLPHAVKEQMEVFDGTWAGIKTDHHRMAIDVLNHIQTKVEPKAALELVSHDLKHMGIGWDEFYKVMAEVRKILKIA